MNTIISFFRKSLLKKAIAFLLLLGIAYVLGGVIAKGGLIIMLALIALPVSLAILYSIIAYPKFGISIIFLISFTANGLGRFVAGPFGLSLDSVLVLTLIAAIFTVPPSAWNRIKNPVVFLVFIWFLVTFFQIFNPEAVSLEAWFYAARGVGFHMMFLVLLGFLIFNKEKNFDWMITVWFIGGILSSLYGMKQLYIGLNGAEKAWLAAGAEETHILFGKLRVFSFYSDAGQFGAFMGYTAVLATILSFGNITFKRKLFYWATAGITFYGLMISGTRGALFVPLSGFLVYLFLSKNFKTLIAGLTMLGVVFFILKFTFIGQSNYQVQRMRSALDPDDPSLQARLYNQRKFNEYLSTRPFGGGIGSAGFWGQRFSPNTFLAETPTDSHYVRIWAETGIVGLVIHLFVLLSILGINFFRIYAMQNPDLKQKAMAIFAGCTGVIVASYGNQVMGQMPTNVFFYISLAFLFLIPNWEKEISTKN